MDQKHPPSQEKRLLQTSPTFLCADCRDYFYLHSNELPRFIEEAFEILFEVRPEDSVFFIPEFITVTNTLNKLLILQHASEVAEAILLRCQHVLIPMLGRPHFSNVQKRTIHSPLKTIDEPFVEYNAKQILGASRPANHGSFGSLLFGITEQTMH